ncbi:Pisatin demethylase [Cyphellophora attinorum]|uniref:Pisatin demethylase n=1 Tax=Cyphellophora attinorum TaxID=1664694 RepID=A0A0N1HPZ2_9EURO|nr:Pisatin demethylase [Phialophora attinorum]KPI39914.1 Pisatin demethylase [Phialophora attinorum]
MDITSEHHTALVVALSVLLLSYIVYCRHFHPLASVPGPFLASITTAWLAHAYWRQDWHKYAIQLHKQYGPVVRIGPNAVDVGDPEAVKVIYGAGSKFFKGQWYGEFCSPSAGRARRTLITIADKTEHKKLRRMIDPLYTLKAARESEALFNEPIDFFVQQMNAKKGQVVDMADWAVALAVDAFTSMTYGKPYGCLNEGQGDDMLAFVHNNWMPYTWINALAPWLSSLEKRFRNLQVAAKVIATGKPPVQIFGWVAEQLKKGYAACDESGRPRRVLTMLERSIRVQQDHPEEFGRDSVEAHMFEVVFAGFETCGATIPKMLYHISTTPGCQDRLRSELAAVKRPSGLDGLATYDELTQLPYLNACIHESYRINPITGLSLSRKVPEGGVTMNGFDIPAGIEIGITPQVPVSNERIMPQPELFRPERWLEATKEERALMERIDLMFGGGQSRCPGNVFAAALLHKVVAVVYSNFRVEFIGPPSDIRETNRFPVKWENVKMRLTSI